MSGQSATAWLCALACCAGLGACGGGDGSGQLATIGRASEPGRAGSGSGAAGGSGAGAPERLRGDGRATRNAGGASGHDAARQVDPQRLPDRAKRDVALIRNLVVELIQGLNRRDSSTCTRLFSQHLVSSSRRAEAVARCERRVAATSAKVKLAQIEVVKVTRSRDTTTGLVQFVTTTAKGERRRHRFHLIRSGESYKVDVVYAVTQPA
jgi:predicted lipid-binding transport protein (Tim44 family)